MDRVSLEIVQAGTCECGAEGHVDGDVLRALIELEMRMGERVTVLRAYQCQACARRHEGYGDSGHPNGTDVDILVYGQYYRHKIMKHVAELFPVISINGSVWHLSVRKDWPQKMCTLAF